MQDDEVAFLILLGGAVLFLVVLGSIATISNRLTSILIDIGVPQSTAGDIGAMVFAGILLLGIWGIVKTIIS